MDNHFSCAVVFTPDRDVLRRQRDDLAAECRFSRRLPSERRRHRRACGRSGRSGSVKASLAASIWCRSPAPPPWKFRCACRGRKPGCVSPRPISAGHALMISVDLGQALPRVPDVHVRVDVGKAELSQQKLLPSASCASIQSTLARNWSRICGIAAYIAATSNLAPRSFERSSMKSCGTLSPTEPNTRLTVFRNNGRSVHMPSAQGTPALPPGNNVGLGNRLSISRMMIWVSQKISAPIYQRRAAISSSAASNPAAA